MRRRDPDHRIRKDTAVLQPPDDVGRSDPPFRREDPRLHGVLQGGPGPPLPVGLPRTLRPTPRVQVS